MFVLHLVAYVHIVTSHLSTVCSVYTLYMLTMRASVTLPFYIAIPWDSNAKGQTCTKLLYLLLTDSLMLKNQSFIAQCTFNCSCRIFDQII